MHQNYKTVVGNLIQQPLQYLAGILYYPPDEAMLHNLDEVVTITDALFVKWCRKIPNLFSKVHYIYFVALLVSMFNNSFNIYLAYFILWISKTLMLSGILIKWLHIAYLLLLCAWRQKEMLCPLLCIHIKHCRPHNVMIKIIYNFCELACCLPSSTL